MADNKTVKTKATVSAFLAALDNDKRRADCKAVMKIMAGVTGKRAAMWGSSLIGYGRYHYKYDSGREGDMPVVGLSPRKQNLVLYIMPGFAGYKSLMEKLGKYKTGKSCLYINKLEDVDTAVLTQLIDESARYMERKYNS